MHRCACCIGNCSYHFTICTALHNTTESTPLLTNLLHEGTFAHALLPDIHGPMLLQALMSSGSSAQHVAVLLALLSTLAAAPQHAHGAAVLDAPTSDVVSSITQSGCPCKENWSYGTFLTGINGCSNPDTDLKVRGRGAGGQQGSGAILLAAAGSRCTCGKAASKGALAVHVVAVRHAHHHLLCQARLPACLAQHEKAVHLLPTPAPACSWECLHKPGLPCTTLRHTTPQMLAPHMAHNRHSRSKPCSQSCTPASAPQPAPHH